MQQEMMTGVKNSCIKTGANLYSERLQKILHGDLFYTPRFGFTLKGCPQKLDRLQTEQFVGKLPQSVLQAREFFGADFVGEFEDKCTCFYGRDDHWLSITLDRLIFHPEFWEQILPWSPIIDRSTIFVEDGFPTWTRTKQLRSAFLDIES